MAAFAGVVTFDNARRDALTEERIGRAIGQARHVRLLALAVGDALFVQRTALPMNSAMNSAMNSGRGEALLRSGRNNNILFTADARLDNRTELAAALSISPQELQQTSDSGLILRMYERWGGAGVARCLGAFAFALWDEAERRLVLGRDCLGNKALFFYRGANFAAFATTLGALLALPQVPRELDETMLANFLAINLEDRRHTFYRNVERVPSRTLVTIGRDQISHSQYWSPNVEAPPPYRRDEDYIERARELFDQAVECATIDTPHVAISASGGLDSSAIAATAARLGRAKSVTCYTVIPPADAQIDVGPARYLDERAKMDALVRAHPALDLRFFVSDKSHPFEEDVTRFFARANMPVSGPTTLGMHAHLYDAVGSAGHQALLVGSYGNLGLTWTGNLSLPALLREGAWKTFAHECRALAADQGRGLARTLTGEVFMPIAPLWLDRLFNRSRGRDPDDFARYSALNPTYIEQSGLSRQWRAQGFDAWPRPRGWNAARFRAHYLFDRNQVGRDYRGMSAEIHGYELRDPHADRRLLEFALAVPEPMFRRNGVPRSFARAVFADRLPREIVEERRRGANGAAWFRRLDSRRQDIAAELDRLDASPLAQRLIDLPRLRSLMARWPKNESAAELRPGDYKAALSRGIHVGRFIRWVEGGNA